jgi:hypothetical protein
LLQNIALIMCSIIFINLSSSSHQLSSIFLWHWPYSIVSSINISSSLGFFLLFPTSTFFCCYNIHSLYNISLHIFIICNIDLHYIIVTSWHLFFRFRFEHFTIFFTLTTF